MPTIAHLSDTHLDTSQQRERRFTAVLDQVAELPNIDALIVSGDLADTGTPDEYEQFFAALPTQTPTLVVAGNHDLSAEQSAAQRKAGYTAELHSALLVDGLTIIGLDSHIDHRIEGRLDDDALAFAREQIAAAPGDVILTMHHPAVPVGHHLMDQHGLHNPDALEQLVRDHDSVIGVLTGHVHTALAATFAGVPMVGAPGIASTMRLGSKTDPIADPDAMPGLALHVIEGSSIRTVFHYLSPAAL